MGAIVARATGAIIQHHVIFRLNWPPSGAHQRRPIIIIIIMFLVLLFTQMGLVICALDTNNHFPSARLIYSLANNSSSSSSYPLSHWAHLEQQQQNKQPQKGARAVESKLVSIHREAQRLRERLELELRVSGETSDLLGKLGAPCSQSADCRRTIENSHCRMESLTCACLPAHVEHNSTKCLPTTLLGYNCQIDAQCQHRVANSFCNQTEHSCACQANFIPYRKDKCLAPSKLNEFCLTDTQCQLNDAHSRCKWKITNIYGVCKCPPNYKLLPEHQKTTNTSSSSSSVAMRCVPRLGDTCLSDAECQEATPNSSCQESSSLLVSRRWPTSSASTRKCHCSAGFVAAQNQLDCIWPEGTDKGPTREATSTWLQPTSRPIEASSKDRYELLNDLAGQTTTTTTNARPTQASAHEHTRAPVALEFANATHKISSLGKSCRSRLECQARDPHSDCIAGVCECLRPTRACSAQAAGCPRDTFQCRNGQCISWYFVCDRFKNCDDGSDEDECRPGACPQQAFQCQSDGRCTTRANICNGKRECADGSDERQCGAGGPPTANLTGYTFEAANGAAQRPGLPARPAQREGSSTQRNAKCHPEAFACQDGTCLPAYVFCNAVLDCPDGSDEDERVCERRRSASHLVAGGVVGQQNQHWPQQTPTSAPPLGHAEAESPLIKTDRAAIERLLATLALSSGRKPEQRDNQQSHKAEVYARRQRKAKLMQTPVDECPRWAHTCRNGKCRSSAILCSGVDGCGDNSDEHQCEVCQCEPVTLPTNKLINTAEHLE